MTGVLPSWAETETRARIIDFVERVCGEGDGTVPAAERVAVFDNDGTLWTEKPMPTQLHYIVQQWAAAAAADPTLAERQPYAAAVNGDFAWLGGAVTKHYAGDDRDLKLMIGAILASTADMNVLDYEKSVAEFYRSAQHMTLGTPYRDAVYQPMVELLRYLEAHGFSCYIVSGGDRDFMRPITGEYYGIPPERVIGSAVGLSYDADSAEVRYGSTFDFMDDGPMKPVRIWSRIGRRPIFAAGNSNGDIEMLRYTQGSPDSLALLIHHDDDSGRGDAPYDAGAEIALAAASDHDFTVVSVCDDWSSVFVPQGAADTA
ncbi:acid phosphatase [Leifsonia sp. Root4]|uniref:HAD family hydrolase n=1 Tax=Leifsonia sp. Root4 TaxID=1736525 RepID=UPI0006FE60BF|nr:HAD family hydrolase [Leifsonia sp. Root4]KQW04819.1 acid phosphatase [Leifsonia sp. Root4]